MKPVILLVTIVLVSWSILALAGPRPAAAAPVQSVYLPQLALQLQTAEQQAMAEAVVELVNQQRSNAGCSPVTISTKLLDAAQTHSQDMATHNYFSHTGLDNSEVWDRVSAAGYAWSRVAENIAAGYGSPESVMSGWMRSGGHADNILNCSYRHIGVGVYEFSGSTYRIYWTQVFAAPQ
jgi:uncharacterized protein YkwD